MADEIKTCSITGAPVADFSRHVDGYTYSVSIGGSRHTFNVCSGCFKRMQVEKVLQSKQHIIRGLLINKKIDLAGKKIHWYTNKDPHPDLGGINLYDAVDNSVYPKHPKEKLENLFLELYKMQTTEGTTFSIYFDQTDWGKFYFNSYEEFLLYYKALEADNILENVTLTFTSMSTRFTYTGLNKYISTFEEGYNSTKVFVAMAFTKYTLEIREAIKRAITATGYIPVIVDEKNVPTDRTINDEIIASLRQAKFVIADFCHHRRGVYFESGFALGQGKQVIFTCQSRFFKMAHFDTKPLQHIIYDTAEELEKKLISHINAWIKPDIE
jgi:hypothetical protein